MFTYYELPVQHEGTECWELERKRKLLWLIMI